MLTFVILRHCTPQKALSNPRGCHLLLRLLLRLLLLRLQKRLVLERLRLHLHPCGAVCLLPAVPAGRADSAAESAESGRVTVQLRLLRLELCKLLELCMCTFSLLNLPRTLLQLRPVLEDILLNPQQLRLQPRLLRRGCCCLLVIAAA